MTPIIKPLEERAPVPAQQITDTRDSGQFFAKQHIRGEKGVDALGSDTHNSPAQLSRRLQDSEEKMAM